MYVCTHACMYVCMCACMYVRTYVCMNVCMYVCMPVMYVMYYSWLQSQDHCQGTAKSCAHDKSLGPPRGGGGAWGGGGKGLHDC